jgi:SpoIID/LytB domain protein
MDMSRLKRTLALALALTLILFQIPPLKNAALAETDGMVRVKLTRLGSPKSVTLTTSTVYYIDNDSSRKIPSGSVVTVTLSDGKLTLKGGSEVASGTAISISRSKAGTGGVRFTAPALANVFCGDMTFSISSGVIQVVMRTYIEDYLYGVVGYEMSNAYPVEALKAQAIAARNYVLRAKSARASKAYDVVDNPNDQVFKGYNSSYKNVIAAVDGTRGVVLAYGGNLAACYYAASNGGQTESTKNAWGSSIAYSVVKDDPYDLESGATYRSVTFSKDLTGKTLNANLYAALVAGMTDTIAENSLSAADVTIDKIVSIEPIKPKYAAPSRLYTYLRFTVQATTVDAFGAPVSGKATVDIPTYDNFETWYGLSINSSSNETVWVDETDAAITVTFRRWGHGIGMSQRGAKVMAQNYSMDYEDILYFYYPGTSLQTITLADKTGDGIDAGDSGDDQWALPTGQAKIKLSSTTSTLNLRKMPTTSSTILTRLKYGAVVDVYFVTGDWTAIGYQSYRGYVMTRYLAAVDASPTLAPTPAPTALPSAPADPTPTVSPTPAPTPTQDAAVYGIVKLSSSSARLRIRKSNSTSSKIVGYLKKGNVVKVLSVKGSWARVQTSGGLKGYIYKKYLKRANISTSAYEAFSSGKIPTSAIKAVATADAFVYQKANTSAAAVAGISKGEICYVLAYSSSWAYVSYGGYEGYVPISLIKKVK